jgi:predicted MFS family arabinose efflux permease
MRARNTLPVLLALVSFMNYTDRMVLPAVAQSIKQEFALSDTTLGLLSGFVFVALYGFASLPLARLADRTSRSLVLAGALAFWSLATAACGLVKTFGQLVVARCCVGIGESACQPVGYALVSEQFAVNERNTAMGWFLLGNNLGITAGFALGGWLGAHYGWRMAFFAVGLPGVLLAIALARFRAPPHAELHDDSVDGPGLFVSFRVLLRNPTYRYLVLLSGVYSMTIFGPIAFLPAFFVRSHGLSMSVVGALSGIAIGIGMAVGVTLGGALADRMAKLSAERPQWLCTMAIVLSGLSFVVVLTVANPWWAFAATFIAAALGAVASPIIAAAVQNEAPPAMRATAASLGTLAVSLMGIGLAPLIIGLLSDALAPRFGTESLRYALLYCLSFCLLTAALHYRVGRLQRMALQPVTAG